MEKEQNKKDKHPKDPNSEKEYDPFFQEGEESGEKKNIEPYDDNSPPLEDINGTTFNAKEIKNERREERNNASEAKPDARKSSQGDSYVREGQNLQYYNQYQNLLRGNNPPMMDQIEDNSYKLGQIELQPRDEDESELLVHFYIKNINAVYPKEEVYKRLYDTLQYYGEVKEINLQRVKNDSYEFTVGMKYDDDAQYIIEGEKLQGFMISLESFNSRAYIEMSFMFKLYLKSLKEKEEIDRKKTGKYNSGVSNDVNRRDMQRNEREYYKDRDEPFDRNRERDKDRDFDKRNNYRSAQSGSGYNKRGGKNESYYEDDSEPSVESRSRSRSKSPTGISRQPARNAPNDDRRRDFDPNKVYQVKDLLNERKNDAIEAPQEKETKIDLEVPTSAGSAFQYSATMRPAQEPPILTQRPEKPPTPGTVQPPATSEYAAPPPGKESGAKGYNAANSYLTQPVSAQDLGSKGQSGVSLISQGLVNIAQPGVPIELDMDNYCLLLGIPLEITERNVLAALKAQDIEQPLCYEWLDEGVIQYLKLGFKSDKTVKELILKDLNVGTTVDDLIYPCMVIPWIKDKKVEELLIYHLVQVESSIPVDSLFLQLFYSPYGPITDVIDMKPTQHVIIFAKQPHAQHVLSIPQISLQKNNVEVVMKHMMVEKCYPLVRKNLQSHLKTIVTQYIKKITPVSIPNAEFEVMTEHQHQPNYQPPPQYIPKAEFSGVKKYDKKGGRYYESPGGSEDYGAPSRFNEEPPYMEQDRYNRGQFQNQNYRMDKYHHGNDRPPERNDYYDQNKRRDNMRGGDRYQGYNQRYNPSPREGGGDQMGFGGGGGGNRSYNFQHGRNQEPRQHQYHQNMPQDSRPQYHPPRNHDPRQQERGMDYRGPQNKGHEQRQQPPYPK